MSFPECAKCTPYDAVARALDDRRNEMAGKWPEVSNIIKKALFIARCSQIWKAVNVVTGSGDGSVKTDRQIRAAAKRAGVDHMIEALEKGVPIEDVLA
jgi:hypothetical protein